MVLTDPAEYRNSTGIFNVTNCSVMVSERLTEIYQLLFQRFGPQHWWPGQTQFEIITGAILTQNTNWGNVEKAIVNLRAAELLTPKKLHDIKVSSLAELIRPAGYYNIKAKRLKNFANWLFENYNGQLKELTADSILLYALNRCVFVVDAYTARVVFRHELIGPGAGYEEIRELFESNLPGETKLFNEYHGLLVRVGKEFCRPKARCSGCPLEKVSHNLDIEYF